ncbi:mitochondrial ornithine carrier protein [Kickxella alabastrina]|uniref:Mitochondrial ornithine carrier protein n=1 Tax=Kickxella alabastrina TaxID=61397 RepID=A0ACC1IQ07_9FUNG|nr:mitochondrial ornithine carrier protein [Kickxella alabastrina]
MESEIQALSDHNPATSTATRPTPRGLQDLAFGSLAGMMGKFVEYPFDTVKVRLQTSAAFSGTIDCLRQTWHNEGPQGFYRGLTSPLVGAMAENALAFYSYNRIQAAIRSLGGQEHQDVLPMSQLFASGALTGVICAFVISPVELVKCKLQVENVRAYGQQQYQQPGKVKFKGPLSVVAHLVRSQGAAGLYAGITPTVARECLGVAFWFGAYEAVCRQILRSRSRAGEPLPPKDSLGPGSIILAGGCAGIAYNLTSYPIDVVKSFIQTADMRAGADAAGAEPGRRPGVAATVRAVYARGGVPAFYRGLGITLLRAFPANAAMFMTYEYLTRLSADLRAK